MRLPTNARYRIITLGLGAAALSGCSLMGNSDPQMASASAQTPLPTSGPAADYPMVLGEPFTVDGQLFTPEDVMNYDEVGYAALDNAGGAGITASHRTLPLPSYVEITSLDSGKTILVRVERRGPMTGSRLVALSPGAQAQLSASEGAAIRVRRVNPPEVERAELRAGRSAAARLETPQSLVAVLRDRLPENGSASLRAAVAPPVPSTGAMPSAAAVPRAIAVAPSTAAQSAIELPPVAAQSASTALIPTLGQAASRPMAQSISRPMLQTVSRPVVQSVASGSAPVRPAAPIAVASAGNIFDQAFSGGRQSSAAYPLAPLNGSSIAQVVPLVSGAAATQYVSAAPSNRAASVQPEAAPESAQTAPEVSQGRYAVQAAAFTSEANASRAAAAIDGSIVRAGRFYRVRTGPYATRGQAEAALAKVRAAGYSDARVFTTG